MAPPSNRRSGHSKRAQYGNFIGYVAAAGGALVGGVLLLISTSDASAFAGLRGLAGDAVAPASKTTTAAKSDSQSLFAILSGYFYAGSENARLRKEVAQARVKLAEAEALADENRRLKSLLDLRDGDARPVAVARLVGSTSSSTRRFATLGAGSNQGVQAGMPVRSPLGLVGRVLEAGKMSARVLLITDTESVVPVKRARDGIPAFASGRGDGTIQLRLISLGINPLKKGDAIVTSGSGGLYPPGVAVAVVTALTSDGAIAQPLSDPGATEFVVVEPRWSAVDSEVPKPSVQDAR